MLKPDQPLRLTIPVNTSTSLKNDRDLIMVKVAGRAKPVPKLVVGKNATKAMNHIKAAITRQLEDQFKGEWDGAIDDRGFAIVSLINVYYKSQFPKSDIDNFHTTFQECLQERVMKDDRQIEFFLPVRQRVTKNNHEYIDSFIWTTEGQWMEELETFFNYYRSLKTDEHRRFESISGSAGSGLSVCDTAEAIDWF